MKAAPFTFCFLLTLPLWMLGACGTTPPSEDGSGGLGGLASGGAAGGQTSASGGDGPGGSAGGGSGGAGDGGMGGGSGGTPATCGDGKVDDGEECDDGEETAACNDNCTESVCGDGITNEADDEDCDDGGNSPSCDQDCTLAECGDDLVNEAAEEECEGEIFDEGYQLTENYCVECLRNVCGDGDDYQLTYAGGFFCVELDICDEEECDDGNTDNGDGCSSTCQDE